MSKLVYPYPPPMYRKDFLPEACWWRYKLNIPDEHGHLYVVTRDGDDDLDTTTYIELEWIDGAGIMLDGGMDMPNVAALCLTYVHPFDYIDLLMVDKPTPAKWIQLTEPGEHEHPECIGWPNEND